MPRIRPVTFVWTREGVLVPLPRFRKQCNEQFVIDEEYPMTILEARSRVSHNHYFASVHEGWKNLPEDIAPEFPSEEHLRKRALVECGYCSERTLVCESADHANALAAVVHEEAEYAVVVVRGNIVKIFRANSQSAADMGREEFQKSKTSVLDWIASLIDVNRSEVEKSGAEHFKPEPKRISR